MWTTIFIWIVIIGIAVVAISTWWRLVSGFVDLFKKDK